MHKPTKIISAQEFRKNPTRSEKIMWNALRNRQFLNLKFRRQYIVGGYIVDFYCAELKLAVEIDGSIHLGVDKMRDDKDRQSDLEKLGIHFFRITSGEAEQNIDQVLKKLNLFINKF